MSTRPFLAMPTVRLVACTLALALAGCRAPTSVVPPPPYDWTIDGRLPQADAAARCAKALPDCARPVGHYQLPPSPCAEQGARCMEEPSLASGRWTCTCDACAVDSDCAAGERCASDAPDCSALRGVMRCVTGPAPLPAPCLAPP